MADHNNNDEDSDALRCHATTSAASHDNNLQVTKPCVDVTASYGETGRRHGDVKLTSSSISDDNDDGNWSSESRGVEIEHLRNQGPNYKKILRLSYDVIITYDNRKSNLR